MSRLFDELLGTSKIRLSVLPFDTDLNINEFPVVTDEARFKCHNPSISLGIRLSCLASKIMQQASNVVSFKKSLNEQQTSPKYDPNALYRYNNEISCYKYKLSFFLIPFSQSVREYVPREGVVSV